MDVRGSASCPCGLNPGEVAPVPMDQYTEDVIVPVRMFWRKHKYLAANRNTIDTSVGQPSYTDCTNPAPLIYSLCQISR